MYIERSWGRWEGLQETIRGGEEDVILLRERTKGAGGVWEGQDCEGRRDESSFKILSVTYICMYMVVKIFILPIAATLLAY